MKRTILQDAHEYRDALLLWLKVRRDYEYFSEPAPEPPPSLKKTVAQEIYDEVWRDFHREG